MSKMTDEELNEALAYEIKDFLLKYHIFNGTCIYFNDKRICRSETTNRIKVYKNIDVTEYLTYCNPNGVNMSFEGDDSFYAVLNWELGNNKALKRADKLMGELRSIFEKYSMYWDVGYSWNIFSCKY